MTTKCDTSLVVICYVHFRAEHLLSGGATASILGERDCSHQLGSQVSKKGVLDFANSVILMIAIGLLYRIGGSELHMPSTATFITCFLRNTIRGKIITGILFMTFHSQSQFFVNLHCPRL